MFEKVRVKLLGVVENLSGSIFGSGGGQKLADEFSIPLLAAIPMEEALCTASDKGEVYKGASSQFYTAVATKLV
jgi:ATP-binding protein involved in chromosome partitioning